METTVEPTTRTLPGPVERSVRNPSLRTESVVALGVFGALTAGAALMNGGQSVASQRWYRQLRKPSFQPPRQAFAPVWTVLYGLIALSGWRVWNSPGGPARSKALGWWSIQLGLNAAWSWLFFRRHQPRGALVNNVALLGSIGAYIAAAREVDRPAAWLFAPYLTWVGFANALNAEIVRRNAA